MFQTIFDDFYLKVCAIYLLANWCGVCSHTTDTESVSYFTTTSYGSTNVTKVIAYQMLRAEMEARLLARQKAPPKYYSSHDSNIAISFDPLQIIDVDGMSQAMILTSIVTLTWRDPEIMWDPSLYAGITDIQLPSEDLWSPSVIVPKSSDNDDLTINFPEKVGITYRGHIAAFIPTFITTLCSLDMTYFPFDEHNCSVVFLESKFYNMTSFTAPPTDIQSHFGTHGEWVMYHHSCYTSVSHMTPPFMYVTCSVGIRRCALFFVLNLIGPMAMTSVMTLIVFWIPAKSGEKIGYVLSMYTSTSVFLSFIVERIPKNMDNTLPRINILLIAIVLQVILATVATAFVLKRYNRELEMKKSGKKNKKFGQMSSRRGLGNSAESSVKLGSIEVSPKQKVNLKINTDTVEQVHIIYADFIRNNDSLKSCENPDGNKMSDSSNRKVDETSDVRENVPTEIPKESETGACEPLNVENNLHVCDKCMTHDELDKMFFAILTSLTIIVYIVVYLY